MRLPDFMIIGAAKSGTTTLYKYLCRHPDIYMSTPKETEFFARDYVYKKGLEWYSSLFSGLSSQKLCGEASTIYTRYPQFPQTAERIYKTCGNIKFIYIMRNPVDRAYSHYVQRIKNAQNFEGQFIIDKTFEERLEDYAFSFLLDSSNYMMQIEQYLRFFHRDSFLFLLMEDLIENPSRTLVQVCEFLNINSEIDLINNTPITANKSHDHQSRFMRFITTESLKKIPIMKRVAELSPSFVKDFAYQLLKRLPYVKNLEAKYVPQPMLVETRQKLIKYFDEPNRKLAKFLNRDLSYWSK